MNIKTMFMTATHQLVSGEILPTYCISTSLDTNVHIKQMFRERSMFGHLSALSLRILWKLRKCAQTRAVVVYVFNPNPWEAEAIGSL